jgi:hypothetical protein
MARLRGNEKLNTAKSLAQVSGTWPDQIGACGTDIWSDRQSAGHLNTPTVYAVAKKLVYHCSK